MPRLLDAAAARTYQNYHGSRFTHDHRRDGVWRAICAYLQPRHIPRGARVLELGAGYCHFINNIVAAERHALDLFPRLPEYAAPGVTAHVRNCCDLEPFAERSLDVVLASNLFEHLDRDELARTLAEIRRVLVPGGCLILIQPNFKYCYAEYFDDYTHKFVFTHVSLCDLLCSERFQIRAVEPRFLPFSMKAKVPKAGWLVRLYLASPLRPMAGQMLVVATHDPSPS
jgi:SAM-dependent methyltransferase